MWQLFRGLTKYGNWQVKLIFVWLLISTIYLMIFPSLLDACSGYEAAQAANFKWPNGTISDTKDLAVDWQGASNNYFQTLQACPVWYTNSTSNSAFNITWLNITELAVEYDRAVQSQSAHNNHSAFAPQPSHSAWRNQTYLDYIDSFEPNTRCQELYSSRANISGYTKQLVLPHTTSYGFLIYNWTDPGLNETWWHQFRQDPVSSQYDYWSDWGFYPLNKENFICNTKNNEYQWGFSYEWLFVVSIVNSVWLVGLWFLWLDCDVNSEFCKKGRRLGLWRAVADISEAMKEELGPNICAYSEQELAQALKNKPPVKYYSRKGTETELGHIGLSSRPSERLRLQWNHEYGEQCQ